MDASAQYNINKKDRKRKAIVTTIVIHLIILALLFLFGLSYEYPPPAEEGIQIAFGDSDQGTGDEQPKTEDLEENTPQTAQVIQPTIETPEEVITQDIEDAPVISDPIPTEITKPTEVEPEITQPKEEIIEQEEPKQVVNQNAIFQPRPSETPNTSTSQGNFGKSGDQGKVDGSKNSDLLGDKNYGLGDEGFKTDLAGRSVVTKPSIVDHSQLTGVVVIKIKVDRNGNVISAKYTPRGSTTTNASLVSKAEKAAYQTQFSESPNGQMEQWGTITVVFKVK